MPRGIRPVLANSVVLFYAGLCQQIACAACRSFYGSKPKGSNVQRAKRPGPAQTLSTRVIVALQNYAVAHAEASARTNESRAPEKLDHIVP